MSKSRKILLAKNELHRHMESKRRKKIGGSLWFTFGILVVIGCVTILPNLKDPAMPLTASVYGGVCFMVLVAAIWTTHQKA